MFCNLEKKCPLIIFLLAIALCGQLMAIDTIKLSPNTTLDMGVDFRVYSLNDQRIYWSGVEFSFGAEAAVDLVVKKKNNWSTLVFETQFFLNQPFGENILKDDYREHYFANFEVEDIEMSKMNIRFEFGEFAVAIGKAQTPFGKTFFPHHSNNLNFGAPFIRSEAILWRETGIFLNWKNSFMSLDVAAVNGEENRDTNSGKAGIFRFGFHGKNWQIGASHKVHDGYGSEWQKLYKGHSGVDFMIRFSNIRISGEWISDKYGFHRPFDEDDIFWPRSLYYRDVFYQYKTPITGSGGYIDIMFQGDEWLVGANYGEYYPQEIGDILHDTPNKRGILRIVYRFIPEARFYFIGLIENERNEEPWSQGAKPFAALLGCEYNL